jgi:hypothetical protein
VAGAHLDRSGSGLEDETRGHSKNAAAGIEIIAKQVVERKVLGGAEPMQLPQMIAELREFRPLVAKFLLHPPANVEGVGFGGELLSKSFNSNGEAALETKARTQLQCRAPAFFPTDHRLKRIRASAPELRCHSRPEAIALGGHDHFRDVHTRELSLGVAGYLFQRLVRAQNPPAEVDAECDIEADRASCPVQLGFAKTGSLGRGPRKGAKQRYLLRCQFPGRKIRNREYAEP